MSFFLNWSEESGEYILKPAGYIALAIILCALLALIFLFKKENEKRMNAKELSFCAVAIALSSITSMIKLTTLPYGGSITLFSMLFICLIGYIYGPGVGVMTGAAYGMLQLITGPYIYHPVQVLLDYPLAFGALGLAGVFAKKKYGFIPGYILGVSGRYICHVISGYVFFASYAPEGTNPLVYTLTYNATYILPEMIATVIILFIPAVTNGFSQVRKMALER